MFTASAVISTISSGAFSVISWIAVNCAAPAMTTLEKLRVCNTFSPASVATTPNTRPKGPTISTKGPPLRTPCQKLCRGEIVAGSVIGSSENAGHTAQQHEGAGGAGFGELGDLAIRGERFKHHEPAVEGTQEPVRRVAPPRGAGGPPAQPPRDAEAPGGNARRPPGPREDINRPLAGTEADARHYAKANADSEFTPRRGGVAAPGGPAPMRLMIATSADGLSFQRRNLIVTDQASVPDLVVDRNGWIWLYYQSASVGEDVNRVALAVSRDAGASWTFRRVAIEGFGSPKPDPCDPEIQLLEDGTFRLFLTWSEGGGRPCSWLAEGRDGVNFRLGGKAFEPPGEALDPSVVRIGRTWHIFAGGGRGPGENWHGTSRDGRLFTADAPMQLATDGTNCMMANGLTESGGARFYAFNNAGPGRPHRIYSFFTRNGTEWTAEPGVRLDADGLPALEMEGFGVLDPAVGRLKDGSHLMIYTTRIPGTQRQDRGTGPPPGPPGGARPE